MAERILRGSVILMVILGLAVVGWFLGMRLLEDLGGESGHGGRGRGGEPEPAPVEVAPIERGAISEHLVVTGDLEPAATFLLAPQVDGRLLELAPEAGDPVERDQVVGRIDSASYEQAVREAAAAVAVATARLREAESGVELTRKAAERARRLNERGVESEAQRERAAAALLAAEAAVAVAAAQQQEAEAALAGARLDLEECTIRASWSGDDLRRVIGERFVDDGALVAAGEPLLSVIDIEPLTAVLLVTESTYGRLVVGQAARLRCEAFPGKDFPASIARIAPRFDPGNRQARVELTVPNADGRLKPGMFVRASLELARVEDAVLVPEEAIISRRERASLFVVSADGTRVRQVPVTIGLRDGDRVQVSGEGLEGRVVILGHQLITDGSPVVVPAPEAPDATP